jgi:hypothetical protein
MLWRVSFFLVISAAVKRNLIKIKIVQLEDNRETGLAQSVKRLATDLTAEGSEFESR